MLTSAVFSPWDAELLSANAGIEVVVIPVIIATAITTIAAVVIFLLVINILLMSHHKTMPNINNNVIEPKVSPYYCIKNPNYSNTIVLE
jgi:hypothetical protein